MIPAVTVSCPACGAAYLLPRSLIGSLGARVTCPACGVAFAVDREGSPLEGPGAPPRLAAPAPPAAGPEDAYAAAAAVLGALERRAGADLSRAAAEGRLFRDHGPALSAAFDEYRARAGEGAGAEAFRAELDRRWGAAPPSDPTPAAARSRGTPEVRGR